METRKYGSDNSDSSKFKSYYVVWKQIELKTKKVGNTMFKSYYVVWKLEKQQEYEKTKKMFKSYYVVWKPCIFFFCCVEK